MKTKTNLLRTFFHSIHTSFFLPSIYYSFKIADKKIFFHFILVKVWLHPLSLTFNFQNVCASSPSF